MSTSFDQSIAYIETRGDNGYSWVVRYDLAFDGSAFTVTTRLDLTGDDPGELATVWESGIESTWNVFTLTDGSQVYDLTFDVQYVDGDSHYDITVVDGYGRGNMVKWYMDGSWGYDYLDEIAAHEYGHMLGMFDEYRGGATYQGYTTTDTLMSDLSAPVAGYLFGVAYYAELYSGLQLTVDHEYDLANQILGSDAVDVFGGQAADDTLKGGGGDDILVGGSDSDDLFGNTGADAIYGNQGADSIRGGQDGDVLYGGRDGDFMFGDKGDDHLSGDRGDDTLFGGDGADWFWFFSDGGLDKIADFSAEDGDRIVLADGLSWTAPDSGSATLTLSSGDTIVLSGVTAGEISESWFVYA